MHSLLTKQTVNFLTMQYLLSRTLPQFT